MSVAEGSDRYFFAASIAYVHFCDRISKHGEVAKQEKVMDTQSLIMLIISAAVTVYLFYALLRPEKF